MSKLMNSLKVQLTAFAPYSTKVSHSCYLQDMCRNSSVCQRMHHIPSCYEISKSLLLYSSRVCCLFVHASVIKWISFNLSLRLIFGQYLESVCVRMRVHVCVLVCLSGRLLEGNCHTLSSLWAKAEYTLDRSPVHHRTLFITLLI